MSNHNSTPPRVALYARVSTKNNGQDPLTQLLPLRDYAQARGFEIFQEYTDIGISGSKERRPALDQLMKDAQRRRFDAVLVAKFDRFARSTRHLIQALEQFNALGVDFISLSESVDTSTPMGKMVFTVIGAVAELERSLIQERVVMGIQRAKKQGKQLGRPKVLATRLQIQALSKQGMSSRDIAKELKLSPSTVLRRLRQKPLENGASGSAVLLTS